MFRTNSRIATEKHFGNHCAWTSVITTSHSGIVCLCKSRLNPFLEPTRTKQLEFLAQGNNRGLWWGSNSWLTGIHRSRVRRATHYNVLGCKTKQVYLCYCVSHGIPIHVRVFSVWIHKTHTNCQTITCWSTPKLLHLCAYQHDFLKLPLNRWMTYVPELYMVNKYS